ELTHDGRADHAVATVRPADRPLLRFRIIKAQSDALQMTSRTVELELGDASAPVPHRRDLPCAFPVGPLRVTAQRICETFHLHVPVADVEIEIGVAILRAE